MASTKPGYKTTEFYAAGGVGATLAPALQDPEPYVRIAAVIGLALVAVGYAWVRTRAKEAQA